MMQSWRSRIASVLNFDPAKAAPGGDAVNILIVDRLWEHSRHLLNIHTIVGEVSAAFPRANVQLRYLDLDQPLNESVRVIWHNCAESHLLTAYNALLVLLSGASHRSCYGYVISSPTTTPVTVIVRFHDRSPGCPTGRYL